MPDDSWDNLPRADWEAPGVKLYCADCRDVLRSIDCADLVFTSPPDLSQREYNGQCDDWYDLVPSALSSIVDASDTQVIVNLGLVHRKGRVVRYWDTLIDAMESTDWRLFGWYIWDQCFGLPGDWNGRYAPSHEWLLHFNKTARRCERIAPSKYAGEKTHGTGLRRANGENGRKTHDGRPAPSCKVPDSVVRIVRRMHDAARPIDHPAKFPDQLAAQIALSYTQPGEIVVDPFVGSGSTGVAAVANARRFVGIEIEPKYFEIAVGRIDRELSQLKLFA